MTASCNSASMLSPLSADRRLSLRCSSGDKSAVARFMPSRLAAFSLAAAADATGAGVSMTCTGACRTLLMLSARLGRFAAIYTPKMPYCLIALITAYHKALKPAIYFALELKQLTDPLEQLGRVLGRFAARLIFRRGLPRSESMGKGGSLRNRDGCNFQTVQLYGGGRVA